MQALIVDDSRAMRRILAKIITPMGFTVVEAENGQHGLDILGKTKNVDLILVDWNMPVMNGLEFVRAVRSGKRSVAVKIVMVTTETETAQMVRALIAGIDEFVTKPFTSEVLLGKLINIGISIPSSVKV